MPHNSTAVDRDVLADRERRAEQPTHAAPAVDVLDGPAAALPRAERGAASRQAHDTPLTRSGARSALPAVAALLVASLLLFAPALYNRYPLVFSDTAAYLWGGIPENRAFGYGVYVLVSSLKRNTLWTTVAGQCVTTALVLWIALRAYGVRHAERWLVGITAVLAAGTSLAWFTAQVMPDFLVPLTVLCALLLGARWERLAKWDRPFLALVLVFACLGHYSNLMLTAGAVGLVLAGALLSRDRRWAAAALRIGAPLAAACVLAYSGNYLKSRQLILTRGGHVFMLGRLAESQILQRLLAERCDETPYVLCPYRAEVPDSLELFMFDERSPLKKLGGMYIAEAPSKRMVGDAIRLYPMMFVRTSVASSARQFVTFGTGDGWHPYRLDNPRFWWTPAAIKQLIPREYPAFQASAEQRDALPRAALRPVHAVGSWLGIGASAAVLLAAAAALVRWRRAGTTLRLPAAADLHAAVWTGAAGNAVLCGTLTTVSDRLQARLVWLFLFAALVSAALWQQQRRAAPPLPSPAGA